MVKNVFEKGLRGPDLIHGGTLREWRETLIVSSDIEEQYTKENGQSDIQGFTVSVRRLIVYKKYKWDTICKPYDTVWFIFHTGCNAEFYSEKEGLHHVNTIFCTDPYGTWKNKVRICTPSR